jgi:hypothetical protein
MAATRPRSPAPCPTWLSSDSSVLMASSHFACFAKTSSSVLYVTRLGTRPSASIWGGGDERVALALW